jgi:23S rRNA pseudouridine1911/1915/1917 synthase
MTSIGHPLLADLTYGGSTSPFIQRQALHACRLSFVHPMTGQQMFFNAVLPNDIKAALDDWSISYNIGAE